MQAALDAAVRAVAELAPIDDVLQVIVDQVRPVVDAQYAALGIVDVRGRIERFITSGMDAATRRAIGPLPEGHGLLGLIIEENRPFRIADLNADSHRYGFPPNHPPMSSFLGVPIIVKGATVGRLYLTNKIGADEFSPRDQALVETFALHAGIAMDNARLHQELQNLAVIDERERISKDLHDGIIQSLYAVGLSLEDVPDLIDEDRPEAAARIERAIDSIHLSIQDIRNFIFGLRPGLLEGASLVGGLTALIDEHRHNAMLDFELEAGEEDVDPDRRDHRAVAGNCQRSAQQHHPPFQGQPGDGQPGSCRERRAVHPRHRGQRPGVRPSEGRQAWPPGPREHARAGRPDWRNHYDR